MFADIPPERENTTGARWNLPEVPAIYTSLGKDVVIAEANYQISMQSRRPKARRTVYKIAVRLKSTLDISDPKIMDSLSLSSDILESMHFQRCQYIGSGVEHLGHDGLIVPSARARGLNLVIYPNQAVEDNYRFEVIDVDVIDPGMRW